MPKSIDEIIEELKIRITNEEEHLSKSKSAGNNLPGFNQDLGARDALENLLEWINES